MRGMIVWKNGEAVVVQDSEKDPVYQFSNGNVINGEFEYEGSALKSRSNQVIVTC
jgi:predicted phage tail protein